MINKASEVVRELPISPEAFGLIAFGVFAFLLYITLRLDKYAKVEPRNSESWSIRRDL